MNKGIGRVFGLFVLLFGLLVIFTSRWTIFEATALRDNPANRRPLLEEAKIKRGEIRTSDGTVLAKSVSSKGGAFRRVYPEGALFGHPVGYSFTDLGRSGLELAQNDPLTGKRSELVGVFESILGRENVGNDLVTTLDSRGQRAAQRALGGRRGAVVAIDVKTGAIRTMYSSPSYDPNNLDRNGRLARLSKSSEQSPLLNRTTQSAYPPGSTFKVVTAAAAIDSHKYKPQSVVNGNSGKVISGVPLANFGGKSFGPITLTTALTNSVNTVWAEVAEKLGRKRMAEYMKRFGFYERPDLDYPEQQMVSSGVRRKGQLLPPASSQIDVGRMGIGQERLAVTPLQMAMVAATVRNDGIRMRPFLMQRLIDTDGRPIKTTQPHRDRRVVSKKSAQTLTQMMKNVVREGTGTAAALRGIEVAGKTGTAELDPQRHINDLWFIGSTPDVAVAVIVEHVQGGQGGTVAAPIAKQVLEAIGH